MRGGATSIIGSSSVFNLGGTRNTSEGGLTGTPRPRKRWTRNADGPSGRLVLGVLGGVWLRRPDYGGREQGLRRRCKERLCKWRRDRC